MSLYKFLENTNLLLTIPLTKCSDNLDRTELKENLIETMKESAGVGLSANQCGVMERAFVMYSDLDKKEIRTCFNPKILKSSEETIIMTEGCLTWPGLWLKLVRPYNIFCSYEDEHGEVHEVHMQDLEARVFQHEMDHMEGTNFTQRVSKLKLNMAKKRASKVKKRADRVKKAQR
jgi:peptide deformylase